MLFLQIFTFFLDSSCSACATHIGHTWYGFTPSLTHEENMPLKHPMHEKITIFVMQFFCYFSLAACQFLFPVLQENNNLLFILQSIGRLIFKFLFVLDLTCFDCSFTCPLFMSLSCFTINA